jgi:hypothetical protein
VIRGLDGARPDPASSSSHRREACTTASARSVSASHRRPKPSLWLTPSPMTSSSSTAVRGQSYGTLSTARSAPTTEAARSSTDLVRARKPLHHRYCQRSPDNHVSGMSAVLKAGRGNDTLIFRRRHSVNPRSGVPDAASPCPLERNRFHIRPRAQQRDTAARGNSPPYDWVFGVYSRPKPVTGGSS